MERENGLVYLDLVWFIALERLCSVSFEFSIDQIEISKGMKKWRAMRPTELSSKTKQKHEA